MPNLSHIVSNAAGKLPQSKLAAEDDEGTAERVLIMVLIFGVSLFAVSFPTVTSTFRSIRVPSILFFIGKHFGTGVILSTAFVHLLQDAFKALQDPEVNKQWRVGDWAGMIVLASLLSIFLVEYISTAFVDRLQSYSSLPPTPTASEPSSSAASVVMQYDSPDAARPSVLVRSPGEVEDTIDGLPRPHLSAHNHLIGPFDEAGHPSGTPLLLAPPERATETAALSSNEVTPLCAPTLIHEASLSYGATTTHSSSKRPSAHPHKLAHVSAPPGDAFFSGGHHRHEPRDSHHKHSSRVSRWRWPGILFPWLNGSDSEDAGAAVPARVHAHSHSHSHSQGASVLPNIPPSTPKRSATGIGIGKSRAQRSAEQDEHGHSRGHNHGHEREGSRHHGHAHLDMERWMHGIDGESDDHSHGSGNGHGHGHMHDASVDEECATDPGEQETKVGRRRQVIGILVLQMGIMIHSLVIGLTLSITTGPEFTSLVIAIVFHQLFEGLSLGIRIAGLPSSSSEHGFRHFPGRTLKPLLAITFATTTPLGIAIGLLTLGGPGKLGRSDGLHLVLVQGVMSAVSAGMLIYAACVEMLAGDFVMDAHLWRSSVRRQVLALASLFAGVAAMAAIGLSLCVSARRAWYIWERQHS
ncbi:Zinc/iron permease [Fomes fomentarius]|nr:Zinc/iron permease [Fomes fomentarius]